MNRAYHKWFSPHLKRDMELLVFGHGGKAVLFFPTRMARFYDYENWGIIEALTDKINNGELQVFCVDSIDSESFYNKHINPAGRIARHLQYEQYILNEVTPFIHRENGTSRFTLAGCSMGAYHAMNLALKYPELFIKVVAMSGRYDLTKRLKDFNDLFDGYNDDNVYFNMPMQYIANLSDEAILGAMRKLEIIVAVGKKDQFLSSNTDFSQLLWSKGIANQLYVWENYAHRPWYWKQMVQLYL